MRTYTAVVERDPDTSMYVGHILGWPGAHTQGESLDELRPTCGKWSSCCWRTANRSLRPSLLALRLSSSPRWRRLQYLSRRRS